MTKRMATSSTWTATHAARIRPNRAGAGRRCGSVRRSAGSALRLKSGISGPDVTFHHDQYVLRVTSISRLRNNIIPAGFSAWKHALQARIDGLLAPAEKRGLRRGDLDHRQNILDLFGDK